MRLYGHVSSEEPADERWQASCVLVTCGDNPHAQGASPKGRSTDSFLGKLKMAKKIFHNLDYELFLYDMTPTYFEKQSPFNPQARRGYSRDQRSDCKQVTLALVVTKEGFPLFFEVFDGNRNDVTTVEEIVEQVESLYGRAGRIWVMDRGMVSDDNLQAMKEFFVERIEKGLAKRWM